MTRKSLAGRFVRASVLLSNSHKASASKGPSLAQTIQRLQLPRKLKERNQNEDCDRRNR